MKPLTFEIIILSVMLGIPVVAQQQPVKRKIKLYDAWVSVDSGQNIVKGILYRVNDSSIVLSDSKNREAYIENILNTVEIDAGRIDFIKTRRHNIVKTGAITGGTAALAVAAGAAIVTELQGAGGLGVIVFILGSPIIAATGAFMSVPFTGLTQIKIPINRDPLNFSGSRQFLERFSYLKSPQPGAGTYYLYPANEFNRNRIFINLTSGAAFPLRDFPGGIINVEDHGDLETGFLFGFEVGAKINDRVSFSLKASDYEFHFKDEDHQFLSEGGYFANVIYSMPFGRRTSLSLKSGLGMAGSYVYDDRENGVEQEGFGPGINAGISLGYILGPRWRMVSDAGYMFSSQKFERERANTSYANLSLGFEYRFLRK